jgi:hypothetical protein
VTAREQEGPNGTLRRVAALSKMIVMMAARTMRHMLRHRALVTVTLVAALLANVLFVAPVDPPELGDNLPTAARCQGGGPGCAVQPLIPPPSAGLPRFDAPAPAVFGQLIAVEAAPAAAVAEAPPNSLERPPALTVAI